MNASAGSMPEEIHAAYVAARDAITCDDFAAFENTLKKCPSVANYRPDQPKPRIYPRLLHPCFAFQKKEMIELLIKSGAEVNYVSKQSGKEAPTQLADITDRTRLHAYTSQSECDEALSIMRLMLSYGVDPNFGSVKPLAAAAVFGSPEACKLLIDAGADQTALCDLTIRDPHYREPTDHELMYSDNLPNPYYKETEKTPFQLAVLANRLDTAAFFIDECGQDPRAAQDLYFPSEEMRAFIASATIAFNIAGVVSSTAGDEASPAQPRKSSFSPL